MKNTNECYVIIRDEFPMDNIMGGWAHDIIGIYRNADNAVARVQEVADLVTADYGDDGPVIEVVYNGPFENWPWLFTWEERRRQITYKVISFIYKD